MVKIDFREVIRAGKAVRSVGLTLILNWAIKPFTMYAIAVFFLGTVFLGVIGPDAVDFVKPPLGMDLPLGASYGTGQVVMAHDALASHARDELGISGTMSARPIQAALASAATFGVGAALPLLAAFLTPVNHIPIMVSISSLGFLTVLGGASARAGGAPVGKAVVRVTFWGALAMAATAGVGALFGIAV